MPDVPGTQPGDKFPPPRPGRAPAGWPASGGRQPELFPEVSSSYIGYETIDFTLAAISTWQEAGRFSGVAQDVQFWASAANVQVRIRTRDRADASAVLLPANVWSEIELTGEIVEARDATGAGTQRLIALGKYPKPQPASPGNPAPAAP
jgi:hypothetical protein